MVGECFINGKDAYTTWGIYFGDESLTNLMTPAPMKQRAENKSALQDGKRIVSTANQRARVDERNVQLIFYLKAPNLEKFLRSYALFVEELQGGEINISTRYQPGTVYHCEYQSCNQFVQFNGRLGKFVLRLNEPNPKNRT